MSSTWVASEGGRAPRILVRTTEEWGIVTADVAIPPRRLLVADQANAPVVDQGVDARRLTRFVSPAELLCSQTPDANVIATGRRSLARLLAFFLVCEDPQRRLDAREVSTLSHQVSLVRHILDNENLRRVLIADEVGLGKTVEAGLVLKELLITQPRLRVLYLAPARLVSNVRREFDRLGLQFRQWSAVDADGRLTDDRVIASIHRAVHPIHRKQFLEAAPWDVVIVDECHHLSDWADGGGDPTEKFRIVRELIARQSPQGRVIFLSGTPHQGHISRFENLLGLLRGSNEPKNALEGRVIFRTKDDIVDWDGNVLFPRRIVNPPIVVNLGAKYREWITAIHCYYNPRRFGIESDNKMRAAGWRCAQALQWAASSPQAGLGYLLRQALRQGAELGDPMIEESLLALRPYRNGSADEAAKSLFERIQKEIRCQSANSDLDDIEDEYQLAESRDVDQGLLALLEQGLQVVHENVDHKWHKIKYEIIDPAGDDKIVFFAQPLETVAAFAVFLEKHYGQRPALIMGGQTDAQRDEEVRKFCTVDGPRFLVSSRAGGEGINLQVARRLVHIDVPWNPMDMEQRVGRVHRFGSRRNIIVDTVVVKDSREEHAYGIARERLRLIASTMVEPERFESLYSRVICLVPPEELLDVLINGPAGPLTREDQDTLGRMVQEGYTKWRQFDERYAQQQRQIKAQDAGLGTWGDLKAFLTLLGKYEPVAGFNSERFKLENGITRAEATSAEVIKLPDGEMYACCDLGGLPAYGPKDQVARQLGLNIPPMIKLLNEAAFPEKDCGAGAYRWRDDLEFFVPEQEGPLGVLVFVKVTLRFDATAGYVEHASRLKYFLVKNDGSYRELGRTETRRMLDGLPKCTVRTKKLVAPVLEAALRDTEAALIPVLQRPSDDELESRMRHAVAPIIACTIETA